MMMYLCVQRHQIKYTLSKLFSEGQKIEDEANSSLVTQKKRESDALVRKTESISFSQH